MILDFGMNQASFSFSPTRQEEYSLEDSALAPLTFCLTPLPGHATPRAGHHVGTMSSFSRSSSQVSRARGAARRDAPRRV